MSTSSRSQEKELLDLGPEFYSAQEYAHCQQQLFLINKLLGCFRHTKQLLKKFAKKTSLLDIGCGGGLFLLHLHQYFPAMKMVGIDINPDAISLAQQSSPNNQHVLFQLQQQPQLDLITENYDIVLITLVCHHLLDHELCDFIKQAYRIANQAVIIHDLHRHRIAAFIYSCVSPLFGNRLIKHDGLISIKRGFTRTELKSIFQQAGMTRYQIKWHLFCWRIVLWK